jgi:hypothetical protein
MRRRRDERGVIAVIVALLAVSLLVMGAVVIDFGMAYVSKNRAQEAADASALTAGRIYTTAKAYCDGTTVKFKDPLPADTDAQIAAVRTANLPNSTGTVHPECEGGTIKVISDVQADSPVGLGALVTDSDHLTVQRHAVVKWGTSQKAVGSLRPWMICGAEVPTGPPFENKVVQVYLPDGGHSPPSAGACTPDKSGGWWKTSCLNAGGSHGDTIQNILVGCDQVTLAPLSTPPPTTPATLGDQLLRDCNKSPSLDKNGPWVESTYCLTDDNGNDFNKSAQEAWDTLLGETVAMPVFCDVPQCNPTSVQDGTKSLWPVWKIAAATICGYDLKGAHSPSKSSVPNPLLQAGSECSMYNTDHLTPSVFDNASNHNKGMGFLLIFKGLIEPGGATTFPVETKTTMRLAE